MRNKTFKFVVSSVLVLAIMASIGIGAYLTSTDVRNDIYTVGNVQMEIISNGDMQPENVGELLPGTTHRYERAAVNTGINDAYVFMSITIPYETVGFADTNGNHLGEQVRQLLLPGTIGSEWKLVTTGHIGQYEIRENGMLCGEHDNFSVIADNTITYVYGYVGDNTDSSLKAVASGETTSNLVNFMTLTNLYSAEHINGEVSTNLYAIQSANINGGLTDVNSVWAVINTAISGHNTSEIDFIHEEITSGEFTFQVIDTCYWENGAPSFYVVEVIGQNDWYSGKTENLSNANLSLPWGTYDIEVSAVFNDNSYEISCYTDTVELTAETERNIVLCFNNYEIPYFEQMSIAIIDNNLWSDNHGFSTIPTHYTVNINNEDYVINTNDKNIYVENMSWGNYNIKVSAHFEDGTVIDCCNKTFNLGYGNIMSNHFDVVLDVIPQPAIIKPYSDFNVIISDTGNWKEIPTYYNLILNSNGNEYVSTRLNYNTSNASFNNVPWGDYNVIVSAVFADGTEIKCYENAIEHNEDNTNLNILIEVKPEIEPLGVISFNLNDMCNLEEDPDYYIIKLNGTDCYEEIVPASTGSVDVLVCWGDYDVEVYACYEQGQIRCYTGEIEAAPNAASDVNITMNAPEIPSATNLTIAITDNNPWNRYPAHYTVNINNGKYVVDIPYGSTSATIKDVAWGTYSIKVNAVFADGSAIECYNSAFELGYNSTIKDRLDVTLNMVDVPPISGNFTVNITDNRDWKSSLNHYTIIFNDDKWININPSTNTATYNDLEFGVYNVVIYANFNDGTNTACYNGIINHTADGTTLNAVIEYAQPGTITFKITNNYALYSEHVRYNILFRSSKSIDHYYTVQFTDDYIVLNLPNDTYEITVSTVFSNGYAPSVNANVKTITIDDHNRTFVITVVP